VYYATLYHKRYDQLRYLQVLIVLIECSMRKTWNIETFQMTKKILEVNETSEGDSWHCHLQCVLEIWTNLLNNCSVVRVISGRGYCSLGLGSIPYIVITEPSRKLLFMLEVLQSWTKITLQSKSLIQFIHQINIAILLYIIMCFSTFDPH